MAQIEVFVSTATEDVPAGIGVIMRDTDVVEDDGALVPMAILTKMQALKLAYAIGQLAEKLGD